MLCCISGWVAPDSLKCHGAFIFRDKQSKKIATQEVLCYTGMVDAHNGFPERLKSQ